MDKLVQALRGIVLFELGEKGDKMVHTVVRLLRARLEEIEEFLVVA
jgi:hypothetical protein